MSRNFSIILSVILALSIVNVSYSATASAMCIKDKCLECDTTGAKCKVCKGAMKIDANGDCVTAATDCLIADEANCILCAEGKTIDSGACATFTASVAFVAQTGCHSYTGPATATADTVCTVCAKSKKSTAVVDKA